MAIIDASTLTQGQRGTLNDESIRRLQERGNRSAAGSESAGAEVTRVKALSADEAKAELLANAQAQSAQQEQQAAVTTARNAEPIATWTKACDAVVDVTVGKGAWASYFVERDVAGRAIRLHVTESAGAGA